MMFEDKYSMTGDSQFWILGRGYGLRLQNWWLGSRDINEILVLTETPDI